VAESASQAFRTVAFAVGNIRRALGWTQAELGRRAGVCQAFVSVVGNMRIPDLTFESATRLLEVMSARLTVGAGSEVMSKKSRVRNSPHGTRSALEVRQPQGD
jgi:predicted transcriptional regulator